MYVGRPPGGLIGGSVFDLRLCRSLYLYEGLTSLKLVGEKFDEMG